MAKDCSQLSKGTLVVLDKLKRHPQFKGKNVKEAHLIQHAKDLSDPDYIRGQFSYLLDSINKIVMKTGVEEELDQDLTSLEFENVRKKDMDNLASAMTIPVKLILRKLNHARPPLANKLSQLLRCEYGPLHSTLQVGEVSIEWGNNELVIPSMEPRLPGDFQTQISKQSQFYSQTKQLTHALDLAERRRDHVEKFDVMFTSLSEKAQLIDRLVDIMVSYNCEKTYSIFKCNCQHFTRDALAALGYNDPIQFSGRMDDYFKQLKAGKLTVPEEYSTHENLDDYVTRNLGKLTQPDMEYLLCQYFKHHLPSMEQMGDQDLDEWVCDVEGCQSEVLDSMVRDRSLFNVSQNFETSSVNNEGAVERDWEDILLPEELQEEAILEKQEEIMRKIKGGYRERVLYKLQHHPDKSLAKEKDIIDKLTERERFRDSFCTNIVEGISEALVVEASADFQKTDITDKEASDRAEKRMKIFSNFPVKILLYNVKRKSSQLSAALQVGTYYFEWGKTSLIVPKKVDELTTKQPILKVGLPQEGVWSSYVQELQPRISQALKQLDYDLLIQLKYEFACKKDELLCALIDTVVRYNRVSAYSKRKCNSVHFIRDAQLALGIAQPNKVSRNVQEHSKKAKQAWKKQTPENIKIETHGDLDTFVEETLALETMNQETWDYVITKYFQFHVSGWEKDESSQWSCSGQNCMLPKVEALVELCMW